MNADSDSALVDEQSLKPAFQNEMTLRVRNIDTELLISFRGEKLEATRWARDSAWNNDKAWRKKKDD